MSTPDRQRIFWLDAAKAYGMFLVYYGHTVERFYNGENQASLLRDRLIYAFQMPLSSLFSDLPLRNPTREIFRCPLSRQHKRSLAQTPMRRTLLGLDPLFSTIKCRKLRQPHVMPIRPRRDQLKTLESHQAMLCAKSPHRLHIRIRHQLLPRDLTRLPLLKKHRHHTPPIDIQPRYLMCIAWQRGSR